jgi:threonine/homoserine/homoserine lactone efflux protein
MAPFIAGLGYGVATVVLIGPVFFTLLKAALDHGVRGGVAVASGIIISDVLIVSICSTSAFHLFKSSHAYSSYLGFAAALVLIVVGTRYLLAARKMKPVHTKPTGRALLGQFTAGFLVNFVNPFVFIIWIALSLHAVQTYGEGWGKWLFLVGVLSGIFATDLLKASFAPRLRGFLNPQRLQWVHAGIGIILFVFALRVLYYAFTHQG